MKGSLAALIIVFRELASKKDWKGKLVLTATVDEEIGGYTGLAYLVDEELIKGDYCIVGDGHATHLTNASNGCLRFKVRIRGHSVHSSMNWLGTNAVEKAAKLITILERYNVSLQKKNSSSH
jgi:succinyl-diaminopimelate desuccinylase